MLEERDRERLYGRAFFYELAHVSLGGEPDVSLMGVLASEECLMTIDALAEGCDAIGPLAGYARGLSPESSSEVERCLSSYNKAMAGLGSTRKSHPWESAYVSSRQLLLQTETLEVRNSYRAFGYLPRMYPKVADDHIALECAFMAALAKRTVAALEADDSELSAKLVEGQLSFLRDHLLKWVDAYSADLHEDVPGSLYDLVVSALASFARQDAAFLEEARA